MNTIASLMGHPLRLLSSVPRSNRMFRPAVTGWMGVLLVAMATIAGIRIVAQDLQFVSCSVAETGIETFTVPGAANGSISAICGNGRNASQMAYATKSGTATYNAYLYPGLHVPYPGAFFGTTANGTGTAIVFDVTGGGVYPNVVFQVTLTNGVYTGGDLSTQGSFEATGGHVYMVYVSIGTDANAIGGPFGGPPPPVASLQLNLSSFSPTPTTSQVPVASTSQVDFGYMDTNQVSAIQSPDGGPFPTRGGTVSQVVNTVSGISPGWKFLFEDTLTNTTTNPNARIVAVRAGDSGPSTPPTQFKYTIINGSATITSFACPPVPIDLVIPDTLGGYPVTVIGNNAFANCSFIKTVTFSTNVTTIEPFAFQFCTHLEGPTFPTNITTIGDWAFYHCPNMGSVEIPDSVTSIGGGAFSTCNLTSVRLPVGLKQIGGYTFYGCFLTHIDLPDTLTEIGERAFWGNSRLTEIHIPYGLTSIGDYAFEGCGSLRQLILPSTVVHLGKSAVRGVGALYCQGQPPQYDASAPPIGSGYTVYYVPGTPGWSSVYAGATTAEWTSPIVYEPRSIVDPVHGTFSIGFLAAWAPGGTVVVEATSQLVAPNWSPISTNVLTTGTLSFIDSAMAGIPSRSYRVRTE